jgi:hypothetical protein
MRPKVAATTKGLGKPGPPAQAPIVLMPPPDTPVKRIEPEPIATPPGSPRVSVKVGAMFALEVNGDQHSFWTLLGRFVKGVIGLG